MSIKLTDEEKKLFTALHASRQLERLRAFYERELADTIKFLISANLDSIQRVQGRAQLLNDLISAIDNKRE